MGRHNPVDMVYIMMVTAIAYIVTVFVIFVGTIVSHIMSGGCGSERVGGAPTRRTALVMSEYVDVESLRKRLPGWSVRTEPVKGGDSADLVYADGRFLQKSINGIRGVLKCRLDARRLFDKTALHEELMVLAPETICKSEVVRAGAKLPPGAVWILKANWGWQGKGNKVVDTQAGLDAAIATLSDPREIAPYVKLQDVEIIASEYIRDPMMYHGYKFHVRIFVVALVQGDGAGTTRKYWVGNAGVIAPAGEKYIDGDYDNTMMHDSHFSKNPSLIGLYPDDLPDVDVSRVNAMIAKVFCVMTPHIKKFPEAENGYDIYGLDVMLTADGEPKLLEINRFPSFLADDKFRNPRVDIDLLRYDIYDMVIQTAVAEVFGEDSVRTERSLTTRLEC
jgi:hypothetical protein